MLSSLGPKAIAVFSLTVIAVLIFIGCSSSNEDASSGKAAAQLKESDFQISSPSFTEIRPKKRIPLANTCYGANLSPNLRWSGAPQQTKSYALIMEDVDYKIGRGNWSVDASTAGGILGKAGETSNWAHWVAYNIPSDVTELTEGIPTSTPELPDGLVQGLNDFKHIGYEGPCPIQVVMTYMHISPRTDPAHRYVFTLYALDVTADLPEAATKEQLLSFMDGHILSQTHTLGKFQIAPTTEAKQQQGRALYREFRSNNLTSTGALITPTPSGSQ